MKTLKQFKAVLLLAVITLVSFSCDEDDNSIPILKELNIVELVQDTPALSDLVAALEAADGDLTAVLAGAGPFTVLAPTNQALSKFLADNNFTSLSDVPANELKQLLLNHVIDGKVMAKDLAGSGYKLTNATGPGANFINIFFETTDTVMFNGTAKVTSADIEATNGIVHIVDAVIDIPTIATFINADSNFSNFLETANIAELPFNFNFPDLFALTEKTVYEYSGGGIERKIGPGFISITPPLTVFAPNNDAQDVTTDPWDTGYILATQLAEGKNLRLHDIDVSPEGIGNELIETISEEFINVVLPSTDGNLADVSLYFGPPTRQAISPLPYDKISITKEIQAGNGVIQVITEYLDYGL